MAAVTPRARWMCYGATVDVLEQVPWVVQGLAAIGAAPSTVPVIAGRGVVLKVFLGYHRFLLSLGRLLRFRCGFDSHLKFDVRLYIGLLLQLPFWLETG